MCDATLTAREKSSLCSVIFIQNDIHPTTEYSPSYTRFLLHFFFRLLFWVNIETNVVLLILAFCRCFVTRLILYCVCVLHRLLLLLLRLTVSFELFFFFWRKPEKISSFYDANGFSMKLWMFCHQHILSFSKCSMFYADSEIHLVECIRNFQCTVHYNTIFSFPSTKYNNQAYFCWHNSFFQYASHVQVSFCDCIVIIFDIWSSCSAQFYRSCYSLMSLTLHTHIVQYHSWYSMHEYR